MTSIQLFARGVQDEYFTGNPSTSFFKSVFTKYTEFSLLTKEIPFHSSSFQFGSTQLCEIGRYGDIIRSITIKVTLPSMFVPTYGYSYPTLVNSRDPVTFYYMDPKFNVIDSYSTVQNVVYYNTQDTSWLPLNVTYSDLRFRFAKTIYNIQYIAFKTTDDALFWGFKNYIGFINGYYVFNFTGFSEKTLDLSGWVNSYYPFFRYYTPYVGVKAIKSIDLQIGGQLVETISSEWIIIYNDLFVPEHQQKSLDKLLGGTPVPSSNTLEYYVKIPFSLQIPAAALWRQDILLTVNVEQPENLSNISPIANFANLASFSQNLQTVGFDGTTAYAVASNVLYLNSNSVSTNSFTFKSTSVSDGSNVYTLTTSNHLVQCSQNTLATFNLSNCTQFSNSYGLIGTKTSLINYTGYNIQNILTGKNFTLDQVQTPSLVQLVGNKVYIAQSNAVLIHDVYGTPGDIYRIPCPYGTPIAFVYEHVLTNNALCKIQNSNLTVVSTYSNAVTCASDTSNIYVFQGDGTVTPALPGFPSIVVRKALWAQGNVYCIGDFTGLKRYNIANTVTNTFLSSYQFSEMLLNRQKTIIHLYTSGTIASYTLSSDSTTNASISLTGKAYMGQVGYSNVYIGNSNLYTSSQVAFVPQTLTINVGKLYFDGRYVYSAPTENSNIFTQYDTQIPFSTPCAHTYVQLSNAMSVTTINTDGRGNILFFSNTHILTYNTTLPFANENSFGYFPLDSIRANQNFTASQFANNTLFLGSKNKISRYLPSQTPSKTLLGFDQTSNISGTAFDGYKNLYIFPNGENKSGINITNAVIKSTFYSSNKNYYISGHYNQSSSILVNGTLVKQLPTCSSFGAFVCKFDEFGSFVWARILDSIYEDESNTVTCDQNENVYFGGAYNYPYNSSTPAVIIDENGRRISSLPENLSSSGFVCKFSSSGAYLFSRIFVSNSGLIRVDIVLSLTCDSSGNVYIGGWYFGSSIITDENGTTLVSLVPATGSSALAFVTKMNNSGVYQYSKYVKSSGNANTNSIVIDSNNNLYIAGYYEGLTNVLDNDGSILGSLPTGSNSAGFMCKFNSSGVYQYSRIIEGFNKENTTSLACDLSGSVYMTGYYGFEGFSTSASILNESGTVLATLPNVVADAAFLCKFNSVGVYQYSRIVTYSSFGIIVSCVLNHTVYITVRYSGAPNLIDQLGNVLATFPNKTSVTGLVCVFNSSGTFTTYYTISSDTGNTWTSGISFDPKGILYITGYTSGGNNITLRDGSNTSILQIEGNGGFIFRTSNLIQITCLDIVTNKTTYYTSNIIDNIVQFDEATVYTFPSTTGNVIQFTMNSNVLTSNVIGVCSIANNSNTVCIAGSNVYSFPDQGSNLVYMYNTVTSNLISFPMSNLYYKISTYDGSRYIYLIDSSNKITRFDTLRDQFLDLSGHSAIDFGSSGQFPTVSMTQDNVFENGYLVNKSSSFNSTTFNAFGAFRLTPSIPTEPNIPATPVAILSAQGSKLGVILPNTTTNNQPIAKWGNFTAYYAPTYHTGSPSYVRFAGGYGPSSQYMSGDIKVPNANTQGKTVFAYLRYFASPGGIPARFFLANGYDCISFLGTSTGFTFSGEFLEGDQFTDTGTVPENTWLKICWRSTINGSGSIEQVFINSTTAVKTVNRVNQTQNNPFVLFAQSEFGDIFNDPYWHGDISALVVYDRSLTTGEIQQLIDNIQYL